MVELGTTLRDPGLDECWSSTMPPSPITSAYETSNSLVDTAKMEFPSGRRGFFAD